MKKLVPRWLAVGFCTLTVSTLLHAESTIAPTPPPVAWHATSLAQAIGNMVIFALVGIVLAIVGYKLFDKCTPGDLNREIVEHRNVAAAIVAAAVILGVCLIIVAAMLG